MVEMAVVKVIDVAAVFNSGMAAARAVLMTIVEMAFWSAHNFGGLGKGWPTSIENAIS